MNTPRIELQLHFSAFAVYVLRHRAKQQGQPLAELIEALLWDTCKLNEAQEIARTSSLAGRAFQEWLGCAYNARRQERRRK